MDSVIFYSKDLAKAKKFYLEIIGLDIDYEQEGKYLSLKIDGDSKLGIKFTREDREIPGAQTCILNPTTDIKTIYNQLKTHFNLKFNKELTELSYGIEFSILDTDGNKLIFLQIK